MILSTCLNVSYQVLAFYDPCKEVQLITDASNHAIGGILLQKEGTWSKPICYISRSLTAAELKYSITEKKALALVWAIQKLHLYLYGKNFKVIVDHKPLKFIFASGSKLNARIARWQIKLQAYDFDVIHQKGEENIADFISRNCTPNEVHSDSDENEITAYVNFLVTKMAPKSISLEDIKTEATDISLVSVKTALLSGKWHDNPILEPYRLLQQKVYWVTINTDKKAYVKKRLGCQANSRVPNPEPIKLSNLPEHVWDELAIDFFGPLPSGEYLFVIEDLYSRYPFVDIIKTTTVSSVISKLERLFAIFGYPNKIRSDNGPPFQSEEFKLYFKNVDIKITPQYSQRYRRKIYASYRKNN
nr:uncharacterized protein LOC124806248 [Hydra vulgaris]